jgi:hypothetical protein
MHYIEIINESSTVLQHPKKFSVHNRNYENKSEGCVNREDFSLCG